MLRRNFIKNSAIFASLPIGLSSFKSATTQFDSDALLQKVIKAMLSMQRACWEQGVCAQAFLEYGDDEMTILMAKDAALRQRKDGRLSIVAGEKGITDPASTGEAVLHASNRLKDEEMKMAAQKMLDYLLNKAPKSDNGIIYHTLNGPEIWSDSMYMSPPFIAVMGNYAEAIKQIDGYRAALYNHDHKLYSHRWDEGKQAFINEKFWGVGNGWCLSGIARVINVLPASFKDEKDRLIGYVTENLEACLKYLRPDGLFHNDIDDPNSFVETNLGQMVAYTIYTGVSSRWLDKHYVKYAEQMREAAIKKVDKYGYVQDVCGSPGL